MSPCRSVQWCCSQTVQKYSSKPCSLKKYLTSTTLTPLNPFITSDTTPSNIDILSEWKPIK